MTQRNGIEIDWTERSGLLLDGEDAIPQVEWHRRRQEKKRQEWLQNRLIPASYHEHKRAMRELGRMKKS